MQNEYYVYVLTNRHNNLLHIGVTNDMVRRACKHKSHLIEVFAQKYKIDKCVYVETYFNITSDSKRKTTEMLDEGKEVRPNKPTQPYTKRPCSPTATGTSFGSS